MKHVYKYPLNSDTTGLELSYRSKVLHVGLDRQGVPSIWIEVPDKPYPPGSEIRTFTIFGTGWDIGDNATYIGTFHQDPYIWHVYETTRRVVGV
jgi:hypothetical protein